MTFRNIFVRVYFFGALILGAGLTASPAAAANCTAAERQEADRWLWLNERDRNASVEKNLPWGAPVPLIAVTNERQLIHWDYVIGYDADLRIPMWTAERVVGSELGRVGRSDCFRRDVRLSSADASTPADYSEPIFDQGHSTPSANLTASKMAVHNSFVMSNMTPQFCQFNRGVWQILEEIVRRWAVEFGTVYVISGSVFDRDADNERDGDEAALRMKSNSGKKRVAIPSAFYKIIAVKRADGGAETLTFLLPHDQTDLTREEAVAYLGRNVSGLARIEQLTGLDLLPNAATTGVEHTALWPFSGEPPRSLAQGDQCEGTAGAIIEP